MSDRELLELAAKAAGMVVLERPWNNEDGWFFCESHGKPAMHFRYADNPHPHSPPWMPLTDGSDTLQLAVKLMASVEISEHDDSTYVYVGPSPRHWASEEWRGDKDAATRRAIVRAAAELGKATP